MTLADLIQHGTSANHSRLPIQVTDGDASVLFLWSENNGGWGWINLTDAAGKPYGGVLTVHAPHTTPTKGWEPAASPAEAAVCYQAVRDGGNYPAAFDVLKAWRAGHAASV